MAKMLILFNFSIIKMTLNHIPLTLGPIFYYYLIYNSSFIVLAFDIIPFSIYRLDFIIKVITHIYCSYRLIY